VKSAWLKKRKFICLRVILVHEMLILDSMYHASSIGFAVVIVCGNLQKASTRCLSGLRQSM